jgi:hypothetical protein
VIPEANRASTYSKAESHVGTSLKDADAEAKTTVRCDRRKVLR